VQTERSGDVKKEGGEPGRYPGPATAAYMPTRSAIAGRLSGPRAPPRPRTATGRGTLGQKYRARRPYMCVPDDRRRPMSNRNVVPKRKPSARHALVSGMRCKTAGEGPEHSASIPKSPPPFCWCQTWRALAAKLHHLGFPLPHQPSLSVLDRPDGDLPVPVHSLTGQFASRPRAAARRGSISVSCSPPKDLSSPVPSYSV
jgi:hypothetical protein